MHQQGCTPDLVGAFIAANLRGVGFAEKKSHLHRELTVSYTGEGGRDEIFLPPSDMLQEFLIKDDQLVWL